MYRILSYLLLYCSDFIIVGCTVYFYSVFILEIYIYIEVLLGRYLNVFCTDTDVK
jgi:hypothetical protein